MGSAALDGLSASGFTVERLTGCDVFLLGSCRALRLVNLTDCRIFSGAVAGRRARLSPAEAAAAEAVSPLQIASETAPVPSILRCTDSTSRDRPRSAWRRVQSSVALRAAFSSLA